MLAFEVVNTLFFFAGFIALGVFLSRLLFCRGTVCASAQAATAFSAILFVLWGVTAGLTAREVFKAGFRRPNAASRAKIVPDNVSMKEMP
jgi:hypothetical protein